MVQLSVVEARVLGALIEKEITTPEYYPLSLNALVNACNQKSSREPVMQLTESEVRSALFALDEMALVRTLADARVTKFEHRVHSTMNLRRDEVAVICLLLLRGPQTPAELRSRTERVYSFDGNDSVATTLQRLASRDEPLTALLPRQPGAREARWMHLLCGAGESVHAAAPAYAGAPVGDEAGAEMAGRVAALEEMVRGLEERLLRLEGIFGGN